MIEGGNQIASVLVAWPVTESLRELLLPKQNTGIFSLKTNNIHLNTKWPNNMANIALFVLENFSNNRTESYDLWKFWDNFGIDKYSDTILFSTTQMKIQ